MEKLKLKDNVEIEILDGASLGNITSVVEDYTGLAVLAGKLTKENLSHVQVVSGDVVSAEYYNMVLTEPNYRVTAAVNGLEVSFGLRERTEEEMQQESVQTAIAYLTDEQALTVKDLYPNWHKLIGQTVKPGTRFVYKDDLYKVITPEYLEIQEQYKPGEGTESLYTKINETHAGTVADPIPAAANMEYEYGKYYKEGETIYLCKRGGIENPEELYGEKVTLQYLPSQLEGQYFEKIE